MMMMMKKIKIKTLIVLPRFAKKKKATTKKVINFFFK